MSRTISAVAAKTGLAVREARLRLNMTQDAFAHALEVAESTVRNWETGRNVPHRKMLKRIAKLRPEAPPSSSAEPGPKKQSRYSEETSQELHAALDLILERAPSTVVQEVTAKLTKFAGRFRGER